MKKNLYLPIYSEKGEQKQKEHGGMRKGGIGIRQGLTTKENGGIKVYKEQLWLTGRNVHFHVQRIR